jgi:hypothetical protein
MTDQYRFENGSLYILENGSYIHCFKDAFVTTKKEAIRRYEGMEA